MGAGRFFFATQRPNDLMAHPRTARGFVIHRSYDRNLLIGRDLYGGLKTTELAAEQFKRRPFYPIR